MPEVIQGDCLEVMKQFPDESFDAVVTDPPYGLEFMGKEWDSPKAWQNGYRAVGAVPQSDQPGAHDEGYRNMKGKEALYQKWCEQWAAECFRLLKPGGYLVAFGGTRTYHRMACAIEDVGFEIRDSLHWMYGSGFPKGKACLKPAHEPVILARKPARRMEPFPGLDSCRVQFAGEADLAESEGKNQHSDFGSKPRENNVFGDMSQHPPGNYDGSAGRWPSNILLTHSPDCRPVGTRQVKSHSPSVPQPSFNSPTGEIYNMKTGEGRNGEMSAGYAGPDGLETVQAWECAEGCPVAGLDAQSGVSSSQVSARQTAKHGTAALGDFDGTRNVVGHADSGGASRFFPQFAWSPEYDLPFLYCAKAPKKERPQVEGLSGHPTVKPLALMRWLVRLVTPPGGIVLDPFAGTGTTGEACQKEDFRYVLIEREESYVKLIRERLGKHQPSLFENIC